MKDNSFIEMREELESIKKLLILLLTEETPSEQARWRMHWASVVGD